MAEFAIASISSMDALNTGVVIPGEQPALGSRLVFTWAQALGLLLSIVAAHLVLLVLIFEAELFRRRVIRGSGAEDKVRLLGKTGREGWRTAVTGRNEGRTGEGGALLGGREAEHVGEGVVEESGTGAVAVATIAGGNDGVTKGGERGWGGARRKIDRDDEDHLTPVHERFTFPLSSASDRGVSRHYTDL